MDFGYQLCHSQNGGQVTQHVEPYPGQKMRRRLSMLKKGDEGEIRWHFLSA